VRLAFVSPRIITAIIDGTGAGTVTAPQQANLKLTRHGAVR
jgi:hypothetical protein